MTVPRVLVVMPDDSPRALLRAALRELGYDAVGARSLASAMRVRVDEPGRGPVRVVVLEQHALAGRAPGLRERLLARHRLPKSLLVGRATTAIPHGSYDRVLRRPVTVAEIAAAVESLVPLPRAHRHPIDVEAT